MRSWEPLDNVKYMYFIGGGSAEVGTKCARSTQTHQALDTYVFAHGSKR